MDTKVYIFDKVAVAEAVRMTAYYLGFEVTRIGSALIMEPATYETITDLTYAPEAALITEQSGN